MAGGQPCRCMDGATGRPGINWRGAYDADTVYQNRDAVSYLGSSYYFFPESVAPSAGLLPTDTAYWAVLAGASSSGVQSIQEGTNITVDATDPLNPIVSASGGDAGDLSFQILASAETIEPTAHVVKITGNNTIHRIARGAFNAGSVLYLILPAGIAVEQESEQGDGRRIHLNMTGSLVTTQAQILAVVYDTASGMWLQIGIQPVNVVQTIEPGANVTVDNTDPYHPVVSASGTFDGVMTRMLQEKQGQTLNLSSEPTGPLTLPQPSGDDDGTGNVYEVENGDSEGNAELQTMLAPWAADGLEVTLIIPGNFVIRHAPAFTPNAFYFASFSDFRTATPVTHLQLRKWQGGWHEVGATSLALKAVRTLQQGANVTIDNTDPLNPIISAASGGGGGGASIDFPVPIATNTQLGVLLTFIPPGLFAGQVVAEFWIPIAHDTGESATVELREDVAGANNLIATATVNNGSGAPGFYMAHAVSAPFTPTALDQIRLDITYNNAPVDSSFVGTVRIRDAA